MADVLPLIYVDGKWQQASAAAPLVGTDDDISLAVRTGGAAALQLIASDSLLDGVPYLWEKGRLPSGRAVYLEAVGQGANALALVTITVSLVSAAGEVVANSTLVISSLTTPKRIRSAAALTLVENTEYLVRYKTSAVAGVASLFVVRLVIR